MARKNPETVVVSGFSEPISFSVRNVGCGGRTCICPCDGHLLRSVLRISPVCGVRHLPASTALLGICRPLHPKGPCCICRRQRKALSAQRATLVGLYYTEMIAAKYAIITKKNTTRMGGVLFGCGGRTRTYDLRVMSKRAQRVFVLFLCVSQCFYPVYLLLRNI